MAAVLAVKRETEGGCVRDSRDARNDFVCLLGFCKNTLRTCTHCPLACATPWHADLSSVGPLPAPLDHASAPPHTP